MKRLAMVGVFCMAAAGGAQAGETGVAACGDLTNPYGPFDYRVATSEQRGLVEGAHFTPSVENLIKGHRGYIGGDIDYTLRVFPNHPRALLAMMNLSFKEHTLRPLGALYVVECYFDRGERFRPDDATVKMLFGIYLLKLGRQDEAVKKLQEAEKSDEVDPNLYYNLGLAFFDLKHYDDALRYAHKAYALNFPLQGLKEKLKKAGKWQDPPPAAPAQSSPAAAASAPLAAQSAAAPK